MVILTPRFGLVKITTHAQDRMKSRFGVPKRALRRIFYKILNKGIMHTHIIDEQKYVNYGHYSIVMTVTSSGHYVVTTVVNGDNK